MLRPDNLNLTSWGLTRSVSEDSPVSDLATVWGPMRSFQDLGLRPDQPLSDRGRLGGSHKELPIGAPWFETCVVLGSRTRLEFLTQTKSRSYTLTQTSSSQVQPVVPTVLGLLV